jgi:type IV pilus assembly protein PilO
MSWRRLLAALAIFVGLEIVVFAVFLNRQLDELDAATAEVETLKSDYVSKKRMAANLDLHREQMRQADRLLGLTRVELPDKPEKTFAGVRAAAKAHGLRLDVLASGEYERQREFYAETSARVVVTGRFHQVGAFISDVHHLPASVRFGTFVIERAPQRGMVTLKGTVRAFRYLTDEEVAAGRKAAKAKP